MEGVVLPDYASETQQPMKTVDDDGELTDDEDEVTKRKVGKQRRTRPVLSKFERAKVLALRAEQIDRGLQPLVERLGEGVFSVNNLTNQLCRWRWGFGNC